MSYDAKCRDLAEYFLDDFKFSSAEDRLTAETAFAESIQKFVEDWLNYRTSDPQALRSSWSGADIIPDDVGPFMGLRAEPQGT